MLSLNYAIPIIILGFSNIITLCLNLFDKDFQSMLNKQNNQIIDLTRKNLKLENEINQINNYNEKVLNKIEILEKKIDNLQIGYQMISSNYEKNLNQTKNYSLFY